jgi:cell division protein YceG involved in septum cleavage
VYFTTQKNITKEFPLFDKIYRAINGPIQVFVFHLNESEQSIADLKSKYKIGNKLPTLRFYKNILTGNEKLQGSYEIFMSKSMDTIMDEIDSGLTHSVKEVNA